MNSKSMARAYRDVDIEAMQLATAGLSLLPATKDTTCRKCGHGGVVKRFERARRRRWWRSARPERMRCKCPTKGLGDYREMGCGAVYYERPLDAREGT